MTADQELRRALEQVLDRHDPEGDGYAKFGGDALLRDVQAALAARSEPRAEGLREALLGQVAVLARVIDGTEGQVPAGWTLVGIAEPGAATPSAEGPDVERLARLMWATQPSDLSAAKQFGFAVPLFTQWAERIAREYAALAPEQPE